MGEANSNSLGKNYSTLVENHWDRHRPSNHKFRSQK